MPHVRGCADRLVFAYTRTRILSDPNASTICNLADQSLSSLPVDTQDTLKWIFVGGKGKQNNKKARFIKRDCVDSARDSMSRQRRRKSHTLTI